MKTEHNALHTLESVTLICSVTQVVINHNENKNS